jgi:hypothetical protein
VTTYLTGLDRSWGSGYHYCAAMANVTISAVIMTRLSFFLFFFLLLGIGSSCDSRLHVSLILFIPLTSIYLQRTASHLFLQTQASTLINHKSQSQSNQSIRLNETGPNQKRGPTLLYIIWLNRNVHKNTKVTHTIPI